MQFAVFTVVVPFALYSTSKKSVGAPLAVIWIGGFIFAEATSVSFLLLFHLSYYSIAYYIKLLRIKLTVARANPSEPYWKDIKNVLLYLHRVLALFQSVFSIPVLFIITTNFTVISFDLFEITYVLIRPNSLMSLSWIATHVLNILKSLMSVVIILHAADMPVHQVRILFQ